MQERESNIELLRLVCMFMIIWIHFTGYSIVECSERYAGQSGFVSFLPQLIHGTCWCAVNAFILISGYFSIRPKAKSFFNFYLTCAFYAGVLYVTHLYLTGLHLNRWVIYNTLMPFGLWDKSTHWWFIPNYLILYMLSPMLNKLIDNISKREFQIFLFLLAIVIFYFGWYRNMVWNEFGLNFINFVFIYFIGRYIALYFKGNRFVVNMFGLLLWLFFGATMGVVSWLVDRANIQIPWMVFTQQYNSPLCIAAAICLFMSFKSMHIKQSKVINWFCSFGTTDIFGA